MYIKETISYSKTFLASILVSLALKTILLFQHEVVDKYPMLWKIFTRLYYVQVWTTAKRWKQSLVDWFFESYQKM